MRTRSSKSASSVINPLVASATGPVVPPSAETARVSVYVVSANTLTVSLLTLCVSV